MQAVDELAGFVQLWPQGFLVAPIVSGTAFRDWPVMPVCGFELVRNAADLLVQLPSSANACAAPASSTIVGSSHQSLICARFTYADGGQVNEGLTLGS